MRQSKLTNRKVRNKSKRNNKRKLTNKKQRKYKKRSQKGGGASKKLDNIIKDVFLDPYLKYLPTSNIFMRKLFGEKKIFDKISE